MDRLNLTLDDATFRALTQHAKSTGQARASLVRELIQEALSQREARERQHRLAHDYAAGRADAAELLSELEAAQLDLLDAP